VGLALGAPRANVQAADVTLPANAVMKSPRHAFTLLELIVVIFIVGAVGALALPKMSNMILQNRVIRAAQMLQTDVQQAFAIAGRNRQPVRLTWTSSKMQFTVTDRGATKTYRTTGLGDGSGFGFASSDITVSKSSLQIYPNGLAEDTLYIKVAKSGYTRIIRVSRAGLVRLQ
jgi:prepilin-type N-terminal cleavage/methylation domain-containing protein